ncbi:tripartite tricarboxylate transporter TctB family protein [Mameliella sediminis]|uniref:tripartite tricarboxylate transporter TctB family protein n=1 Tax=Mameliella sediminis TaxID=2836866 RepID=UPI001C4679DA|nr:tripartite tricarboxylate transporter TctB family protein [Mameliella sediminis]MBV7396794.1 tripartite tricarboxylate transporter TctB family protein [Mameliella sediminis]
MRIEPEHHDGTSDATPGGEADKRRPGELAFAAFLCLASLYLLRDAWGIENAFGPNGLSSPRSIPLATTCAMVVSAAIVLFKTARLPLDRGETLMRDILPWTVILFAGLLAAYGALLKTVGFLPVSAVFLVVAIKVLARRGWGWTLAVALMSLLVIWLIFRIVFSVLMPAGIVPEGELIQFFRGLTGGGGA